MISAVQVKSLTLKFAAAPTGAWGGRIRCRSSLPLKSPPCRPVLFGNAALAALGIIYGTLRTSPLIVGRQIEI